MGDYPDIPFVQAAGDGGPRAQTQMVVIHATDNTASDEGEASYATHRPDRTSAHFYSDEDSVIQGVLLSHVAYGCYPIGNSRSVQFELSGLSNRLTDATLRRVAPIVRRVCDRYGIPIRHVGPAELRAGAKGICGHGDVTLAWGQGTHTDPGASFPWATFIGYVDGVTPQQEESTVGEFLILSDGPVPGGIYFSNYVACRYMPAPADVAALIARGAAKPYKDLGVLTVEQAAPIFGPPIESLKGAKGDPGAPGPAATLPAHTHDLGGATGPAKTS